MVQASPVPHDILEFAGLSGVAGDTLQRGWLSWRRQIYAALLFQRLVYDEVASATRYSIYFKVKIILL